MDSDACHGACGLHWCRYRFSIVANVVHKTKLDCRCDSRAIHRICCQRPSGVVFSFYARRSNIPSKGKQDSELPHPVVA